MVYYIMLHGKKLNAKLALRQRTDLVMIMLHGPIHFTVLPQVYSYLNKLNYLFVVDSSSTAHLSFAPFSLDLLPSVFSSCYD